MSMLNIGEAGQHYRIALWHLGFRPFFLGAALWSIIAMLLWLGIFGHGMAILPAGLPPSLWHAHEMIYGYAVAVIAGFLLTAVRNWTGIDTLHGVGLMLLALLWLVPRILLLLELPGALTAAMIIDVLFAAGLLITLLLPIVKAGQKQHSLILLVLLVFPLGNLLFYLPLLGWLEIDPRHGLYLGFYAILAMILIMGRRVIPFFIEKGVDTPVKISNWKWVDIGVIVLFFPFAALEIFAPASQSVPALALLLLLINSIRLWQWHVTGIWRKPLLWVLYLAYGFLVLGFLLVVLEHWAGLATVFSRHAFAAGGIGVMTIGMMSRVALGHTGRNVFVPPRSLIAIFLLLAAALCCRVLIPIFDMARYVLWIELSQILWIAGFAGFMLVYAPMLIKPRIDGQYG